MAPRPPSPPQKCPVCHGAFRSKKPATYCSGACRMAAHRARREADLQARLERAEHACSLFLDSLAELRGVSTGKAGT
jgi:hypothetical protein